MAGIIIALAAVVLVLPFALVAAAGRQAFGSRIVNYNGDYVYLPEEFPGCEAEDWETEGNKGQSVHVRAYQNRLAGTGKGTIFWSSGIGGDHSPYLPLLCDMAGRGYRVVAYDPTGTGRSGGKRVGGLTQNLLDGMAVLDDLKRRNTPGPLYLMGHSNGGYTVLAMLAFHTGAKAAAVFAAFNRTTDMILFHIRRYIGKAAILVGPYVWLYFWLKFGKAISFTAYNGLSKARIPVFFMQSRDDDVVPYSELEGFERLALHSRSVFRSLNHREHETMYPPEIWAQMRPLKRRIVRARKPAELRELSVPYFELGRNVDKTLLAEIDSFFSSL